MLLGYYANYTQYGDKVVEYLSTLKGITFSAGVELHLRGDALRKARRAVGKLGWRSFCAEGLPRQGAGTRGGCWTLVRKEAAAGGFGGLGRSDLQWSACSVRRGGIDLILVTVYFFDGLGCTGDNLDLMEEVGVFLRGRRGPFLIIGDFNIEPDMLEEHGWPQWLGAAVVRPPVPFTCTSGQCRVLDYALVSCALANHVVLLPDFCWALDAPHRVVGAGGHARTEHYGDYSPTSRSAA